MQLRAQKNIRYEEIEDNFVESSLILHQEEEHNNEKDMSKLEKCIQLLKIDQKSCVELFYLKELCYREIVIKTGMDLAKVKSHIQNGKRNLKICMEQSG
jgi:RNA polymerase sigma-70 factor (ECF subfamily)